MKGAAAPDGEQMAASACGELLTNTVFAHSHCCLAPGPTARAQLSQAAPALRGLVWEALSEAATRALCACSAPRAPRRGGAVKEGACLPPLRGGRSPAA
ncbi:unnamed protein product [Rangifer tarandus platyrhynchus]|uniref:Uncharacterized protein n=1 Tax=Rangifer tarandus platyrhynchus TaxID=3082113 RepID=A0AC59Y7W6_RANTA